MSPKKKILYDEYVKTHFNIMYDGIFRDKYDTYDNRYKWCYTEYMNGIKYDRSKKKYINTSNRYVLEIMYEKTRLEERSKIKELSYDIILPIECIKPVLSPILPDGITNLIYSFYRSTQPYVKELQDWFGENSDLKNYDDNQYEAQASLILEFVDVDKYFPNADIYKLMQTDYFKSHQIVYSTDEFPHLVEIKSVRKLLDYLNKNIIPYEANLYYNSGETMIEYGIPFDSDSE